MNKYNLTRQIDTFFPNIIIMSKQQEIYIRDTVWV